VARAILASREVRRSGRNPNLAKAADIARSGPHLTTAPDLSRGGEAAEPLHLAALTRTYTQCINLGVSAEYRAALDAAVREYERAIADRTVLDTRIAQLRQTIGTLTKLCGLMPTVPLGLTDAVRMVLRNAQGPVTATWVRDRLDAVGIDLDRYANALAAIHTVLKRLVEAGEAHAEDADESSRVVYQSAFHPPTPATPPATPAPKKARPRRSSRP
jgi:hypothetical protein